MKHIGKCGRLLLACSIFSAGALAAQQSLDNAAVERMVKAGLGDATIVQVIGSQPGSYDLSPDGLIALKQAGVSDTVMHAMIVRAGAPPSAPAQPAVDSRQGAPEDMDMGVYRQEKSNWSALSSERVNWKTGGFLKSVATDGIVKGDINGRLTGADSTTKVTTPLQFLLKGADGVDAGDFQLVHLHQKSAAREFRTVTGGVFHASGGASRDAVPFDAKPMGHHAYLVTFTTQPAPGEYAFLAPGYAASSTSGSTSKAYTFQVIE